MVVKPISEAHGNGVSTHIINDIQYKEALQRAYIYEDKVIVQEQIQGDEFRVLVV
ncbi:MAG: hypothetical protein U9Q15_00275 [Patescibacteria group bacterium]|nr:hypothetical protein [Patescibacteria group bacterium]